MANEQGAHWFTERRRHKIEKILRENGINPELFRREFICRRIEWRARSLGLSPSEYVDSIEKLKGELQRLIRDFTVKVTSFFRDPEVWYKLEDEIIPEIARKWRFLNIWCAGCSTGEEAYSVAATCVRSLKRFGLRTYIRVIGSDIDREAIEIAKSAKYPRERIKEIPERYREYFEISEGYIIPRNSIRGLVEFKAEDISRAQYPEGFFNLILLRNVLIYMSKEIRSELIRRVSQKLKIGGLLILGKSEVILSPASYGLSIYDLDNRIYRRIDYEEDPRSCPWLYKNRFGFLENNRF